MTALVSEEEIERLVRSEHSDPFSILGAHPAEIMDDRTQQSQRVLVVRAFLPGARQVWVVLGDSPDEPRTMERAHSDGLFELILLDRHEVVPYQLRVLDHEGGFSQFVDPYCFLPVLTDFDLYLMGEGNHYKKYEKLGAHLKSINGILGVQFAVWAPNALRVSVIGDFNNWDGRRHPMRVRGNSGIWELFIPGLEEGMLYKFEVKSRYNDLLLTKADPYGFYFEKPPKTASIVYSLYDYEWHDQLWM